MCNCFSNEWLSNMLRRLLKCPYWVFLFYIIFQSSMVRVLRLPQDCIICHSFFFGEKPCEVAGLTVVPLCAPETLLAFVLSHGAGFAASTAHVCIAARDEPGYCSLAQTKLSMEHSVS